MISFYIFLSTLVCNWTNLLIVPRICSSVFLLPQLNYSCKPQQWASVTLASADGYLAHSLTLLQGCISKFNVVQSSPSTMRLLLSPSLALQLKASYRCFKAHHRLSPSYLLLSHALLLTDPCASSIQSGSHHSFLKFWTMLFSSLHPLL